jgi:hypothetical protein
MEKSLKEQILELKASGHSYLEIKNKLGCSKGTICYHLGIGQKDKTGTRRRDGRNRIRKFLQEYKSGKRCADCGEDYPYWMLEFDHLRDKSFTIGRFSSKTTNLEIIKDEISKCEIVCCNCHKNRTFHKSIKNGGDVDWETCKYPD